MSKNKIKVPGYSQKVVYDNQIEYRNYSPDLVGLQLTSDGGSPLFTMGNFSITTNLDGKLTKFYDLGSFSNFVTLSDLSKDEAYNDYFLSNNLETILKLDKTILTNYVMFGSLTEFIRVSLENIIINWPASLFIRPNYILPNQPVASVSKTVENYSYNPIKNESTFRVSALAIDNKFNINYNTNGSIVDTFNETNDLRNLTVNYKSYSIRYLNNEYDILAFTGSTNNTNEFITLVVNGDPFSGTTNDLYVTYHIKPNKKEIDLFFNTLPDFEGFLLNRQVTPIYTSVFNIPIRSNNGLLLYTTDRLTWPTSDGYNIDFTTTEYEDFVSKLLNISNIYERDTTNLMVRFLTSESITEFDTTPLYMNDVEDTGQRVNKLLNVFGRQFDETNKYIKNISFANVVSYNQLDNTPDKYLKNIAMILGWDLVSSVLENDLLKTYITNKNSSYSGQSVGLTPAESEIELWRRIILNSPWIWKSKGTRKAIEFIFKFIGIPNGLIEFNEYVYVAEDKLNIELFEKILELNDLPNDNFRYSVDPNGYPYIKPDNNDVYFQSKGLWYRETGGNNTDLNINKGNNPHIGPYDGGSTFIEQFKKLINEFSSTTITSTTKTYFNEELFTNYNLGYINDYNGDLYYNVIDENNNNANNLVVFEIIDDPHPTNESTDCGCETLTNDKSIKINIGSQSNTQQRIINDTFKYISNCDEDVESYNINDEGLNVVNKYQYLEDGSLWIDENSNPVLRQVKFFETQCCTNIGGLVADYNEFENGLIVNSGNICCATNKCGCYQSCKWLAISNNLVDHYKKDDEYYLTFVTELGQKRLTSVDGCGCIVGYTDKIYIEDPFYKDKNGNSVYGYACKFTNLGLQDIINNNSKQFLTYLYRNNGTINCTEVYENL